MNLIPCEFCGAPAKVACISCTRPICDTHTLIILIPAPANDESPLTLEICPACTARLDLETQSKPKMEEKTAAAIIRSMTKPRMRN